MRPDAGDAQPSLPAYDGPVLLIGTIDGAGDRLADLLGCHPSLCRIPRTRLLTDLAVAIERNQPALAVYGLSEQYWRGAVGAFFDGLQRHHASRADKARWVAYVSSSAITLKELWRLFPTAQFVHVITAPRGGAGRIVAANRRIGAGLPAGTYLEVAEGEMLTGAEACARRVLRFLAEEASELDLDQEVVVDLVDVRLGDPERR
jgi:hypothetical protein